MKSLCNSAPLRKTKSGMSVRERPVSDTIAGARDGNSGACPRAWPGNAHCGAGLGKDIMARLVAGLAGQDRDGTGPKRDGPKRDAGKH